TVEPGEIFGLLGPNGAGKTTSIRIILDIMKPDRGSISILGGAMDELKKNKIGYLPEERGLYQDITLDKCLSYLASLKNLDSSTARKRIDEYLVKFDLADHRKKKLKEMSKGMQQKAQLIATLVHDPDIIIIDEPFNALDPVNTQMVKDLLVEQKQRGKTVVMCTHQMHQVEELCDRLVLINKGKVMLYGELTAIRKQYAGHDIRIRTTSPLPAVIAGIESIEKENGGYLLKPASGSTSQSMLRSLVEHNITLEQFEIATPTLDDIFIQVVTGSGEGA
ncbi:MAG TPA: ATP-binding cassette domain-containing protein, partial [Longilinea sp.]|nr:ATP-binding cassette domain-containing protein [Longilinea sp.]